MKNNVLFAYCLTLLTAQITMASTAADLKAMEKELNAKIQSLLGRNSSNPVDVSGLSKQMSEVTIGTNKKPPLSTPTTPHSTQPTPYSTPPTSRPSSPLLSPTNPESGYNSPTLFSRQGSPSPSSLTKATAKTNADAQTLESDLTQHIMKQLGVDPQETAKQTAEKIAAIVHKNNIAANSRAQAAPSHGISHEK